MTLTRRTRGVNSGSGSSRQRATVPLHHRAIAAAMAAVDTFPSVDRLAERLTRATDPRLRRVGPAAAGVDAGAAGAAGAAAAGS